MTDEKIAARSNEVTDEMWQEVCEFNRDLAEEFLENQTHLSEKSQIQYKSGLRIFFWWVKEKLNNKPCIEIKKKEFIKYLNWLTNRGLSDSAIKLKKSCVSSLCNYILNMYEDEYPTFRSFVTTEMKVVQTGYVHEKKPITPEELKNICKKLEELEEWQKLAWILFSYSTGCRRAESRQLLKEVVNYEPIVKKVKIIDEDGQEIEKESLSYKTHKIRCKGRSKVGKVRQLQFGQEAMDAIKKWLEIRGEDDCPYVFVTKQKNKETGEMEYMQVSETTFNAWCSGLLTDILGRRLHPHLLRESRATNLVVEEHRPIETAQKLLGHESSETTSKHYVIRKDTEDADDAFV